MLLSRKSFWDIIFEKPESYSVRYMSVVDVFHFFETSTSKQGKKCILDKVWQKSYCKKKMYGKLQYSLSPKHYGQNHSILTKNMWHFCFKISQKYDSMK